MKCKETLFSLLISAKIFLVLSNWNIRYCHCRCFSLCLSSCPSSSMFKYPCSCLHHGSKRYFPVPVHVMSSYSFFPLSILGLSQLMYIAGETCIHVFLFFITAACMVQHHKKAKIVEEGMVPASELAPVCMSRTTYLFPRNANDFFRRKIERKPRSSYLHRNWPILSHSETNSLIVLHYLSLTRSSPCVACLF